MIRLDTGTGPNRRRLTTAEAAVGDLPTPFTADEWHAMHVASAQYEITAAWRRLDGVTTGQSANNHLAVKTRWLTDHPETP